MPVNPANPFQFPGWLAVLHHDNNWLFFHAILINGVNDMFTALLPVATTDTMLTVPVAKAKLTWHGN